MNCDQRRVSSFLESEFVAKFRSFQLLLQRFLENGEQKKKKVPNSGFSSFFKNIEVFSTFPKKSVGILFSFCQQKLGDGKSAIERDGVCVRGIDYRNRCLLNLHHTKKSRSKSLSCDMMVGLPDENLTKYSFDTGVSSSPDYTRFPSLQKTIFGI